MKNWLDLNDQAQKHIDRGMDVGTITKSGLARFLYSTNYYRFSGYARCFYDPIAVPEKYLSGTKFEEIREVYSQDLLVRQAILEGVAIIEPVMRARFAYHFSSVVKGTDDYFKPDLYLPEDLAPGDVLTEKQVKRREKEAENRAKVIEALKEATKRPDAFIQHHLSKGDPVPFWALIEVLSIGDFSRILRALRDKSAIDSVAKTFRE